MLTSAIAMSLVMQRDSAEPGNVLRTILNYYRSLQEMLIEMDRESSGGDFPGQYKQTLSWKRSQGFQLQVSNAGPGSQAAAPKAPSWYRNGDAVWAVFPDGRVVRGNSEMKSSMLGDPWELAGGPLLSTLENTQAAGFILDPTTDSRATYKFGSARTWKGQAVQEIMMTTASAEGGTVTASFFVSPDQKRLIGMPYKNGKQTGWVHYRTQKLTFKLDSSMSAAP